MTKSLFFKFMQRIVLFAAIFVATAASVNAQELVIGPGTINLASGVNWSAYTSLRLNGNVTFTVPNGSSSTIGIPIHTNNAAYTVTVQMYSGTGGGLFLTGNNTYTGTTTINSGVTLLVGNNTTTGAIAGNIVNNGSLWFARSNDYTYTGIISGSGTLEVQQGIITLSGTNTYTGNTFIYGGTLAFNRVGNLGASSSLIYFSGSGGTLRWYSNNSADISSRIRYNGTNVSPTFDVGGEVIFASALPNTTGTVTITGMGRLVTTAAQTYTGSTHVVAGIFSIGNSDDITATGSIAGNISLGSYAELRFHRGNTYTYSGIISGAGEVHHYGTGTTILTGANTYTGETRVSYGVLQIGAANNLGSTTSTANIAVGSSGTLRFMLPDANVTFGRVITGTGNIQVRNSGAGYRYLYLTGDNTFTGTTTAEAYCELSIGNGGATGELRGNIVLTGSANYLFFNRTGSFTYPGVISNTGTSNRVSKQGSGTVILTGANTFSGDIYVENGTLQVGNGTSGSIVSTGTATLQVNSGATLRFEPGASMIFSRVISGTGSVQYSGSLTKALRLTGTNTYTGTTTIETGGLLMVGNGTPSGAIAGNIVNNGILRFARTNAYTYSGIISGTGEVSQHGLNTLTLNGANTYTGETYIDYSTLALGANGTIAQSSQVIISTYSTSTKFDISAGNKTIKALNSSNASSEVVLGTRTLTIGTSATVSDGGGTFEGIISGTGGITKTGTATLYLTGTNTYTGNTTISAGSLYIGNSTTTGVIAGNIVNNAHLYFSRSNDYLYSGIISGTGAVTILGGYYTLTFTGNNTYTGTTTISSGVLYIGNNTTTGAIAGNIVNNATLYFFRSNDYTYAGVISGTGTVFKGGSNTVYLTGNNTCTGVTSILSGTLAIGNNTTAGAIAGNIINNTQLFFLRSNDYTYSGVISGVGDVTKTGSGNLYFTGDNFYAGVTTIGGGSLYIGNNTTTGAIAGNIVNNANLHFYRSNAYIYYGVISGTGTVSKSGAGELRFIGNNTYTGTTTINTGNLYVGNSTTTGAIAGNIVNNGMLLFYRSNDYTYNGVISGTGNVYQYSHNGTLTFGGANTYTGQTYIYAPLVLGTNGSIASSSSVTLVDEPAAKLDVSAGDKTIKALSGINASSQVVLGTRTLTIGTVGVADGGGTFAGIISGTGGITKTGTATLYLTGNNTYTGITTISAGNLYIGNNTATGAIAGNIVNNAHLYFSRSNYHLYSGIISGTGAVTKLGADDLTFRGNNTYTGTTTISAGVLYIGENTTTGAIAGNIVNNATLFFLRSNDYTYSGVISGTGTVAKSGANSLFLTGNNTYTGVTTIFLGTLAIGNNTTTGAIAGNITNNANLQFSRSNEYTYAGVISGTGNVSKSGANSLILTGNNTYTGSTTVLAGTLQVGNGIITTTNINSTSNVVLSTTTSVLRFELGATMTFSKVISGIGRVECKSSFLRPLYLTANNTFTGTTTIEPESYLYLGNNSSTGSVVGNIVNNGSYLIFSRSNDYIFPFVISGSGAVRNDGSGKTTLSANNTYTGMTWIGDGTLALGSSGSIENSSEVYLATNGKFDISAGNKKIKFLRSNFSTTEIILGARILTIGTTGATDGGGVYQGFFSGTGGGITKVGTGAFTMEGNNTNTATGIFSLNQGKLVISNGWQGNFIKETGTELDISGSVYIGGSLTVMGGNIYMNLTTTPPSRMIANGVMNPSGINTLVVTLAGAVTNQMLFQAASGITSTPFTLNMPGFTGSLEATGTQLLITANVTDNDPPVIGDDGIVNGVATANSAALTWTAATDNQTPVEQLRYFVYRSLSNNISTVANCEANGTLLNPGGTLNISNYDVFELIPNTNYWFNVVVSDQANNKAVYIPKALTTNKATLSGTVTIAGNAVFDETLTADITNLSSTPSVPLETLTYQWKRGATNIGTNSTTYALVADDIGSTITVIVTASNCDGSITSNPTATVTQATQTAPAAPELLSKTATTITLVTIPGCEYSMNGGVWQDSTIFGGLTPNTSYSFTARKAETATLSASPASPSASFITNQAILSGTVTIVGSTVFGETLSANTNNLSSEPLIPLETFTYQWQRGTTNIGTNSSNYTLVEADINSAITVTVTASNCDGSITSDPTATITKATQTAPDAPELLSKTATSITLVSITDCEYNMNGGVWQSSTAFSDLTPNTPYSFTARKTGTATHSASPESSATSISTAKAVLSGTVSITGSPVFGQTLGINTTLLSSIPVVSLETLTYQWHRGTTNIGTNSPNYTLEEDDINGAITVTVTAANCDGSITSDSTAAVTKATQPAPDAPELLSKTATSITLVTITGGEYSMNGGAWQESPTFSGLVSNTSYSFTVRKIETATHLLSPESPSASFTTDRPVLSGTVIIVGSAVFGETLTANTNNLSSEPLMPFGTITYQWQRGTTNIGTNSPNYTLEEDDINSAITVTVTAANCDGSITSDPTATITKATQTAPAAPELLSKTATSITLVTITGGEYNMNGGVWQSSTTFSDLTPNTPYSFTARKAETATHSASPESSTTSISTAKAALSGTVSITGSPVFGQTLGVNTTLLSSEPLTPLGALTYQWQRDGNNIGDNSSNYTLVEADINSVITVTVTASNCDGSITSDPTAAVTKATQTAPDAPELLSKTATSITLVTITGGEYSMNGGAWQESPTFSGLVPNTSYSFTVRKIETATHLLSPESPSASFTTDRPVLSGTVIIVGSAVFGETLTANTNNLSSEPLMPIGTITYQWQRGATNIGTNSSSYTLVEADINSVITVTVTASNCDGSVTSNPTAAVTKATQSAPDAPELLSKTATSITLVTITGCEYSMNGNTWQELTTFYGLSSNTSYSFTARKKETATHLTSEPSGAAIFTTEILYHTITASVIGSNGDITPSGAVEVANGEDQTFTIIPAESYRILLVLVDGIAKPDAVASGTYTFENVTANHTIEAIFQYVGIEENDELTIKVFSHNNVVTIINEAFVPLHQVDIMDMYGRSVWKGKAPDVKTEITLNVATGVYVVRIITEKGKLLTNKINISW